MSAELAKKAFLVASELDVEGLAVPNDPWEGSPLAHLRSIMEHDGVTERLAIKALAISLAVAGHTATLDDEPWAGVISVDGFPFEVIVLVSREAFEIPEWVPMLNVAGRLVLLVRPLDIELYVVRPRPRPAVRPGEPAPSWLHGGEFEEGLHEVAKAIKVERERRAQIAELAQKGKPA